jgi:hypothetical protein
LNEPFLVPGKIIAGGGHNEGGLSENGQAVCNISGCSSEFFDQAVYVEADVQDVNFVRQNVIGKVTRKIHNAVISQ